MDRVAPLEPYFCIDPSAIDEFEAPTLEAILDCFTSDGIEQRRRILTVERGSVAVVEISGMLAKWPSAWGVVTGGTAGSDIAEALDSAVYDPSIAGILLRINSPGGVSLASESACRRIRAASGRKPIATFIDGECGGEAYSLAAACPTIFASPLSRLAAIGHVEIVGGWMMKRTTEDEPATVGTLHFRSGGTYTPDPAAMEREVIDGIANRRRNRVQELLERRPTLDRNTVSKLAEATMSAEAAEHCGFVDEILPFDAAIERVRRGDVGGVGR